jgi:putative ABC transport system permease protein
MKRMPRIFLLAALRNLLRHKVQSLINIASLAIGLTVFGFAFIYVKQELSYDRWIDGERVHRLLVDQRGVPGAVDQVHSSALDRTWQLILDYFAADIEAATRSAVTSVRVDDAQQYTNLKFVDPEFVDVFTLEVIDGDLKRAVSGPGFVAIDEVTADRLGMLGRVGERLRFTSFYDQELEYELAAIYRTPQPLSSATSVSMLTLIHDYSRPLFDMSNGVNAAPWQTSTQVWLKLKPGVTTEEFNAQQPEFIAQNITTYNDALGPERKISDHLFYRWQPVTEIRFNPMTSEMGPYAGDLTRVATFAMVGLLVLLVGCSNSVSLSLAAALERRREIGVRKAAGALPHEIMWQRLGESSLMALLALVPAIVALELLLPPFQALFPAVRVNPGWNDYALLTAIAGMVGIACGAYPALVLASTRPQVVLRAGAQQERNAGLGLRTVLVAVQFCFASMLLIGTAALYVQLAVARAQPLGFSANNIVTLYQNGGAPMEPLRVELEKVPGVSQVIFGGSSPPAANLPLNINVSNLAPDTSDTNVVGVQALFGDYAFIEFMGIRVLAGRAFDEDLDAAVTEAYLKPAEDGERPAQRIVINATAARQLGFFTPEAAVGQTLYQRFLNNQTGQVTNAPMQIIGVVEDNLYMSLRRRPGPEMYLARGVTGNLILKFDEASEGSIQDKIKDTALRVLGAPLSGIIFVEPQIEAAFRQEQNESKVLLICGGLALMLASFGLYGLAAFTIGRQVKEVGVRKVMGAGVGTIVGLYLWRFSRPIVVANLVAWPVAVYFALQWIQRFPYQMERAWLVPLCISTLGAVLLIAMLTVSVITTRAATSNPVRSLRYE